MTAANNIKRYIDSAINRGTYTTWRQFNEAIIAQVDGMDEYNLAREILEAAKTSNGRIAARITYARSLARYAADNPLER